MGAVRRDFSGQVIGHLYHVWVNVAPCPLGSAGAALEAATGKDGGDTEGMLKGPKELQLESQ